MCLCPCRAVCAPSPEIEGGCCCANLEKIEYEECVCMCVCVKAKSISFSLTSCVLVSLHYRVLSGVVVWCGIGP